MKNKLLALGRIILPIVIIASFIILLLPQQQSVKADALDLYWFGGSGNFSDTAHWGTSTNGTGAPHAAPTSTNAVIFDANSGNGTTSWTVTATGAITFKSMDWTGATGTPILVTSNQATNAYSNITLISAMTWTNNDVSTLTINNSLSITSAGHTLPRLTIFANVQLNDDATTRGLLLDTGTITTNNHALNVRNNTNDAYCFKIQSANAKGLAFGSSTVNVTDWLNSGTNLSVTSNTATITISGTGGFAGGGVNYNGVSVNLTGTAHAISGSNNVSALNFNPTATQTITFSGTSNNTITTATRSGTGLITLQSSNTSSWLINKLGGGNVTLSNVAVSRSTASPASTFYATAASLDNGNNSGWIFPYTITTNPATGVSMNKDGFTAVTLNGSLIDLGGSATVKAWFDYGTIGDFSNHTDNITYSSANYTSSSASSPAQFTPNTSYNFRFVSTNGTNSATGATELFTFTMPTPLTNSAVNISMNKDGVTSGNFSGNATSMGVATTSYGLAVYGLTGAYGSVSSSNVTVGVVGNYQVPIPNNLTPGQTYHTAAVLQCGSVNATDADSTFTLTLPSVTTGTVTRTYHNDQSYITVTGTLDNMGVASSTYIDFNWGYTPAMGNNVTMGTALVPASFNSGEIAVNSGQTVYFQISARVGSVVASGGQQSVVSLRESDLFVGVQSFGGVIPLLVLIAALVGSGILIWHGFKQHNTMEVSIGFIFIGVLFLTYNIVVEAITAILTR